MRYIAPDKSLTTTFRNLESEGALLEDLSPDLHGQVSTLIPGEESRFFGNFQGDLKKVVCLHHLIQM